MEQEQARRMRVTAGFDGYVDTISRVVRRKGADGSVEYFSTIAEFGAHVTAKAGKSASIELLAQQVRAGGNLPLFAKALCALGMEVTAVGAMGWPQLHPAFEELAAHPLCTVRSVAQPGLCDAAEFDDGKLMLAHNEDIEALDAQMLRERLGQGEAERLFGDCDLAAFMNWSEVVRETSIWKELAGSLTGPLLVDLSDCSARSGEEIREMFALLSLMARRVPVTLSANKNELEQLGRGLGLAPMHPVELAQTLHERLNGARVVAHLTAGAFSVSRAGLVSRKNVHFDKPVLSTGGGDNFNAGLALGLLNGMEMGDCLAMGNAVSGWYVSHGASPTLEQAAELMRSGAYDEELTEV